MRDAGEFHAQAIRYVGRLLTFPGVAGAHADVPHEALLNQLVQRVHLPQHNSISPRPPRSLSDIPSPPSVDRARADDLKKKVYVRTVSSGRTVSDRNKNASLTLQHVDVVQLEPLQAVPHARIDILQHGPRRQFSMFSSRARDQPCGSSRTGSRIPPCPRPPCRAAPQGRPRAAPAPQTAPPPPSSSQPLQPRLDDQNE